MKPLELDTDAKFTSIISSAKSLEEETTTTTPRKLDLDGPYQDAMTPTETVVAGSSSKDAPNYGDPRWKQTITPADEWPGDYPKPDAYKP
jgi:hypothetical protein